MPAHRCVVRSIAAVFGSVTILIASPEPTRVHEQADVRDRLRAVEDPDLGDDVVSLGLVNAVDVTDDEVSIDLALGAPYSPAETGIATRSARR